MKMKLLWVVLVLAIWVPSCSLVPDQSVNSQTCQNMKQIADGFLAANDKGNLDESLSYMTDDVALVYWAEGANGHHVNYDFAVGPENVKEFLGQAGLRTQALGPDLPNFTQEELQVTGSKVTFKLMPDRIRPNGRPYNHYVVELVFSGCKIEIIKLVERVTWL